MIWIMNLFASWIQQPPYALVDLKNFTIQAACESLLVASAPWPCQWMFGMPRNLKIGSVTGFMNPVAIFGHFSEHAYCIYCTNAQIHCLEHLVCLIFTWWIVTSLYSLWWFVDRCLILLAVLAQYHSVSIIRWIFGNAHIAFKCPGINYAFYIGDYQGLFCGPYINLVKRPTQQPAWDYVSRWWEYYNNKLASSRVPDVDMSYSLVNYDKYKHCFLFQQALQI